jgi:DNA repair photolyase
MRSRWCGRRPPLLERGVTIYMSTVTDPYQPVERWLRLTRAMLTELVEVQPRLTIQTRSPIAVDDIDLFQRFERIRVNFTVTTDDDAVRKRYEPHCPSIEARLRAAEAVAAAGVPIGISISPLLPLRDAEAFGYRIARLDAAEYVTQYFKPTRSRFAAGTSPKLVTEMRADGWDEDRYHAARAVIQRCLGARVLLEGAQGYGPP